MFCLDGSTPPKTMMLLSGLLGPWVAQTGYRHPQHIHLTQPDRPFDEVMTEFLSHLPVRYVLQETTGVWTGLRSVMNHMVANSVNFSPWTCLHTICDEQRLIYVMFTNLGDATTFKLLWTGEYELVLGGA